MYVCMYVCTYAHMYVWMYACMHVCMHRSLSHILLHQAQNERVRLWQSFIRKLYLLVCTTTTHVNR